MATELGVAYLSIVPSTDKIRPAVKEALGEVEGDASTTGKRAGGSLSSALGSALKGISAGIVGVTSLVGGLAMAGGISRALSIENAQAKLTGLGHDAASVSQIMSNALASVKGTAYGLGDAASVAAGLVAAGVQQGTQLEGVLKTVADTATISGRSLTDIGTIFGSVAARGKLQGDDMLQLMSSGVPVLQMLSAQLGVSSADVSEMVSAGKVDFATFAAAMQAGMGGAALASGTTFTGALANVRSALGRLGAQVATPGLDMLKGIFNDAIPAIDALTTQVTPLISALADRLAPAIASVSGQISAWVQGVDLTSLSSGFSGLSTVLLPLGGLIAGLGGTSLAGMFGPLGALLPTITGPMGAIIGLIAAMLTQSPELRTALGDAFFSVGGALQNLAPLFPPIMYLISGLAGILGDTLAQVLNGAVVPLIRTLANDVLPALIPALSAVMGLVGFVAAQIGQALVGAVMALVPPLMQLISAALPVFVAVLSQLLPVVGEIIGALLPVLVQLITSLAPVVLAVVQAFLPLLPLLGQLVASLLPPITTLIMAVIGVVASLAPLVVQLVQAFLPLLPPIMQLVSALLPPVAQLLNALMPIVTGVVGVLASLLAAIMPVVTWIAGKLVAAISALIQWVTNAIPSITGFVTSGVRAIGDFASKVGQGIGDAVQWFRDLPGKISDIFSGAGTWLAQAGRKIIDGLIDGIKGAFSKVKDALTGLTSLLPDWKGPAEVDAKLLTGNGRLIMQSLVDGFRAEAPGVQKYLSGFTSSLSGVATANVNVAGSGLGDQNAAAYFTDEQVEVLAAAFRTGARAQATSAINTANSRTGRR